MSAEFIAIIIGFTTLLLTIAGLSIQINNRLDDKFEKLDDKIAKLDEKFEKKFDKLENKIEKLDSDLSARIDKLYDVLGDLYKSLFKKDAA